MTKTIEKYERLKALESELTRIKARGTFSVFLSAVSLSYRRQWFHQLIADKCQALLDGTLGKDKLMLFVPPQHGKSEIVSRKFPAWALGINPRLKIVGSSYSADLAQQFSRSIQRTIDSREYADIFPNTFLNGKNTKTNATRGFLRNVDMFETVGYGGFYKAVGVCGSLTGTPADIAIIDDPVKDSLQAYSETYRQRVWDWYTDVLLTRLHNKSKQLLIMTRWHEDDLAGRLLKTEADEWEVVKIPAIREDYTDKTDPRKIGEALWEEQHSIVRLRAAEKRSPRTFAALYQQRPSIQGGNIVHREWFKFISKDDFVALHWKEPIVFFLDTAYDEQKQKSGNDPSGIIATCRIKNTLYIVHAQKVYKEFPQLVEFLPQYLYAHGYNSSGSLRVEPKSCGKSVVQYLKNYTDLNVVETPPPTDSKSVRLSAASPSVEGGRVVLVEDTWNEEFIDELCGFPSKPHDEYVDVLGYAVTYHLNGDWSDEEFNDEEIENEIY